jgi:acyl transferase domain-containing protein
MKTIALFPGTDAIEMGAARVLAMLHPRVSARINEADRILKQVGDIQLGRFMIDPLNHDSLEWFQCLAVATVATQVGLFEELMSRGNIKVDGLCGLSLGDAARTVCMGAFRFEDAVLSMAEFVKVFPEVETGITARVKTPEALSRRQIDDSLPEGVYLSVRQTPRHFLVAGDPSRLREWMKNVFQEKKWVSQALYPFPLHSPLMKKAQAPLYRHADRVQKGETKLEVFSSIRNARLHTPNDVVVDAIDNVVTTVDFSQTLEQLYECGYRRFINLGPSDTLEKFIALSPIHSKVEVLGAADLFKPKTGPIAGRMSGVKLCG